MKPNGKSNGAVDRHQQGLEEILRKSSGLMARVGFHGTSMRELSRATGRSLSGLYHYFTSKEDLLFLVNYHGFTTLNETWRRMAESFETPEERLYGFVYQHTHYYVDNIDEMRVMNWGTQELEYKRAMTIKKLKDRHTADARDIIQEIHTAAGHPLDQRALERQTFLLFGMMNWIFGWYSSRTHGGIEELIRDIYRTFMYGASGGQAPAARETLADIEAVVRESFGRHSTSSMWETAPAPDLKEAG
jgi:AcrR family transcriptional regulator